MTSSVTTTASGSVSTRCRPIARAMESSANCTTRQKLKFARSSRPHQALERRRRLATSTNHLWIPKPSKFAEFLRLLMTLQLSMASPTYKNLLPSWPALKCAASVESLEQPSTQMRWIPIPISSTSARADFHSPTSRTTAKNSSLPFAPLSSIM